MGSRQIVLTPHQQQIHDFLVRTPYAAAWLPVGGGKTLSTLAMLQTVRPGGHILVVAPIPIARSTWLDEITKWEFPIRTRSLIADDRDVPLSKEKRLQRFREVFSDPPTMYFISRELLTQPSHPLTLVYPSPGAVDAVRLAGDDPLAVTVVSCLVERGPMSRDDLVTTVREVQACGGGKPSAVSTIKAQVTALLKAGIIAATSVRCPECVYTDHHGKRKNAGCSRCAFGLIDQMPVTRVDGRPAIMWPFPTVIIDEAQSFKGYTSRRFKALAKVRPGMSRLVELTGTPAPNGLTDIWSQIFLLDQGKALGRTITEFHNNYCKLVEMPIRNQLGEVERTVRKYVIAPGAEKAIYEKIDPLVLSARNTSIKLPELRIEDVPVELTEDQLFDYVQFNIDMTMQIIKSYVSVDGKLHQRINDIIAKNATILTNKLLQFASGTVYTSDMPIDDPRVQSSDASSSSASIAEMTGEPSSPVLREYVVVHEKKLDRLELLLRAHADTPVLLTYHFQSSLDQIRTRCAEANIDVRLFDKSRAMVREWNEGNIPVMVLHPASAGHGLNLQQGGCTVVWYTLPFSLEHYLQTNGRLYRTGQSRPVTVYRLLTQKTHDVQMPGVLASKENAQDDLLLAMTSDSGRVSSFASHKQALCTAVQVSLSHEMDQIRERLRMDGIVES